MKKLAEHDKLLKRINKRFEQVDKGFDATTNKLMEYDIRLEFLEENVFLKKDQERLFESLDKISGKLDRLDQKATFSTEWLKRLQTNVEKHDKVITKQQEEIYQIKSKVGM